MTKYSSKRNFLSSLSVDRRFLTQYVYKKLKRTIPIHHISSVIGFLFDELIQELLDNKPIVIGNFGKFIVKKLGQRRHFDVVKKVISISNGNKILRFQLNKDIRKILTNNLDVAKTFQEDQNG